MKRYGESERRALVGDFESSGMSAAAFCRQVGITAVTVAAWRRRLGTTPEASPPNAPQWVPVVVGSSVVDEASLGVYILSNRLTRFEIRRRLCFARGRSALGHGQRR
jgi:transposase-like protein